MIISPGRSGVIVRAVTDHDGAVNEDLYCLACGYNLRGLYGDPIRCPECGHRNHLGDVTIPAEVISQALRQMETAPTTAVAFAVAFCTSAGITAGTYEWRIAIVPAVLAVAWLVATRYVRSSFEDRAGWKRILVDFHVATLLCTLLIPMMLIALTLDRYLWAPARGVAVLLAIVLSLPWLVVGLRVYFASRRRLAEMQREAAVRLAREILFRTLRHRR